MSVALEKYNQIQILKCITCSMLSNRRRRWHPTPVLLSGESHGWRSLVGCGPWGHSESDTTEQLHFHFSLSCIGEGNGNLLQCSCLENPRDGGGWWAAVYGVAQSWTRLKRLSSSSWTCWLEWCLSRFFRWLYISLQNGKVVVLTVVRTSFYKDGVTDTWTSKGEL